MVALPAKDMLMRAAEGFSPGIIKDEEEKKEEAGVNRDCAKMHQSGKHS